MSQASVIVAYADRYGITKLQLLEKKHWTEIFTVTKHHADLAVRTLLSDQVYVFVSMTDADVPTSLDVRNLNSSCDVTVGNVILITSRKDIPVWQIFESVSDNNTLMTEGFENLFIYLMKYLPCMELAI